jgi:phenylacetate-CoA ligase
VEIVDDAGKPVSPGESGRLLWTSTVCRGTPLLRYDIGDLGSFDLSQETEAGVSQLRALDGRFAGVLTLPGGKKINCIYWNHLFKEFPEVHQFQVALQNHGKLAIRLQGSGMAEARDASLRQTLRNFIGDLPLTITWVERIPLTPRGKLLQVVSEQDGAQAAAAGGQAAERF